MRILLVLLIIVAMIGWNKGWWGSDEKPANAPVVVQQHEPGMVDSVKQWFIDHTPKK
jgi:hypothetical protein